MTHTERVAIVNQILKPAKHLTDHFPTNRSAWPPGLTENMQLVLEALHQQQRRTYYYHTYHQHNEPDLHAHIRKISNQNFPQYTKWLKQGVNDWTTIGAIPPHTPPHYTT